MPSETTDVATRFVDLALKHKRWDEVKTLPLDEVQVLFDVVSAAGFNPKEVASGKLEGHYRDQGGSITETYPINPLCPFKVVDQEDGNHYFATGWLDCALGRVINGMKWQEESREELIKVMAEEIELSVPLEPIQLTPEGDHLCEYPPSTNTSGFDLVYFVKHQRDENDLGSFVGVHEFCNGRMDRSRSTETHDVIVCRKCHLRVSFPKEVNTYGDLRQAFTFQVPA